MTRDRSDSSGVLADSWKNQLLLNLVTARHRDLYIYLDVGPTVSGYRLETSISILGVVAHQSERGGQGPGQKRY